MKSINFEFLRPKWPELSGLGGFAEAYAQTDAVGAISKLRMFCEQVVEWIHFDQRLPKPYQANLNDLMANQAFKDVIPDVVLSKLHALRKEGNKSVHGNAGDTTSALRLLREAFNVARWLHVTYAGGTAADCPVFVEPPKGGVEGDKQRKEKRAILERITAQEAQMQKLLADLEAERSRATQAEATAEERRAALEAALQATKSLQAIDPLAFNEDETRRHLIDQMLADAGWDVGKGLVSTNDVVTEAPVQYQVGPSGEGKADYLLADDNGKPLGVVEAKKTSRDPQLGRKQAEQYADGLEKEQQQRPVIFYTNGYDNWIWNDHPAAAEPPRKIYGFYSKDSLQHLHFQRTAKKPIHEVAANPEIAGWMFQMEAVRRVVERFGQKKRKALIVQATGTGKTRVAISLCDALIKANWAKRILFLCDRRELRKQANKAFNEFMPSLPRTYVKASSAGDTTNRIFLSTYPAMMKIFESFDIGFFDLIICDESHRSLYNRYRQILEYFDSYTLGLTATPVDFLARNTFKLFDCEEGDPTSNYDYATAVAQKYLVPFEVTTHTTQFLREGIKYSKMTAEQKRQIEEDEAFPQAIEFEQVHVDKIVYNKDTNRKILSNLMQNGIRVGTRLGKSIIFARSMKHARMMEELFNEMYPQYGGKFCQTIVSDDPRAESLIDDFKGEGSNPHLTIAISVDMLDIAKFEEAWKFDRLIAQLQVELIRGGSKLADLRDEVINLVSSLRINLSQVKVRIAVIERVKSDDFWNEVTVGSLEEIREQLRGIIQFRRKDEVTSFEPITIDVAEDESQIITKKHKVRLDKLDDLDMAAYRNRVNNVLQAIIDQNETLRKIRLGQSVTNNDLDDLCSLVLTQEPGLDLHNLMEYFQQAESLDQAIREIIGMDADAVQKRFTEFRREWSPDERRSYE